MTSDRPKTRAVPGVPPMPDVDPIPDAAPLNDPVQPPLKAPRRSPDQKDKLPDTTSKSDRRT
ncbi:hypothetical protein GCM10028812_50840 [Ancylobacter sonchi]